MLLDDAIDAAGLGSQVTILDERNRRLALGLSVNWGIRTLLAYATEAKIAKSRASPPTRDLSWVRAKVRSAGLALERLAQAPSRRVSRVGDGRAQVSRFARIHASVNFDAF
jgi:hypothetical protein